jgi:hypothetical protein
MWPALPSGPDDWADAQTVEEADEERKPQLMSAMAFAASKPINLFPGVAVGCVSTSIPRRF